MVALGRVVEHDPRSLAYPVTGPSEVKTKTWRHYGGVLDQGQVGSCTGNATAQALNTRPYKKAGRTLMERDALNLYHLATTLDGFPGTYPPDDNGSSGLAAAKAAQQNGWISAYTHAFGLDHLLSGLMTGPAIVGTEWHEDMFNPDARGFIHPTGSVAGGHEYLCLGVNMKNSTLKFLNSWSKTWGVGGFFYMTFADFTTLLANDGDAVFFTP